MPLQADGVVGFRHAAYDTPLWRNPNRNPGRYNGPGGAPTQYLCGHPAGPWAELLRGHNASDPVLVGGLRLRLWAVRVPGPIFEISFGNAQDFSVAPYDLVADDWGPCQELAARVAANSALPDTFAVPSAALPGTVNIVIVGPRVAVPFDAEVIDDIDVPVAHTAEDARALASLVPLVRYRGMRHLAYDAWAAGMPFGPVDVPGAGWALA